MRSSLPAIPPGLLAIQRPEVREALSRAGVKRQAARTPWKSAVEATRTVTEREVVLRFKGLRLVTEGNTGEHYMTKARRAIWQKRLVGNLLVGVRPFPPPVHVTVTRIGRKLLDARDNNPGSMKHIVDATAAWCGLDDADPRFTWEPFRQTGKGYGVTITIRPGR